MLVLLPILFLSISLAIPTLDYLYLDHKGCLVYLNETYQSTLEKDVDFAWIAHRPSWGDFTTYYIKTNLTFSLPSLSNLNNVRYMSSYLYMGPHYFIRVSYDVDWGNRFIIKSYLNSHQLKDADGTLKDGAVVLISQPQLFLKEGTTNKLEITIEGKYNYWNWDPVTQITIKSFKLCLYNPTLKIHLTSQIPDKISPGQNVTIEGYVENPSPVDASAKISLEGFSKYFNIFPSQPYNVEIDNVRTQDNKVRFKFILTLKDNLSPEDKLFIEQQNNQLKLGKIKVSYKNKYFSVPWTSMEKDLGKITFQDVSKSQEPQSNKTPQEQPQQEQEVKEVIPIWVWIIIGLMALIILVLLVKKL